MSDGEKKLMSEENMAAEGSYFIRNLIDVGILNDLGNGGIEVALSYASDLPEHLFYKFMEQTGFSREVVDNYTNNHKC